MRVAILLQNENLTKEHADEFGDFNFVVKVEDDRGAHDNRNESAAHELSVEDAMTETMQLSVEQGSGAKVRAVVKVVRALGVLQEEWSIERHVVQDDVGHKCEIKFRAA